jgi:hypothetical protein
MACIYGCGGLLYRADVNPWHDVLHLRYCSIQNRLQNCSRDQNQILIALDGFWLATASELSVRRAAVPV